LFSCNGLVVGNVRTIGLSAILMGSYMATIRIVFFQATMGSF